MEESLGIAPRLSLDAHDELRGQKLQEIAVELLSPEEGGVGVEVVALQELRSVRINWLALEAAFERCSATGTESILRSRLSSTS